jgi:hypothetical protein
VKQFLWRLVPVAMAISAFASMSRRAAFADSPVIERYEESRPEEAGAIMEILRTELAARGALASPSQLVPLMSHAPKPSVVNTSLTSAALTDELELAVKSFLHVRYEAAVGELELALTHAKDNPGLVVNDERTRSAVERAQVALALTYRNLGDRKKAVQVMTDYIRGTPESVPKMFGPPGEDLYREVRKIVDPIKRGNLAISVSEPDAQLFLSGRGTGHGSTFAGSLLPGVYCVVVQVGSVALRYDVPVFTGSAMTLQVNWAFESRLHISVEWLGMVLPKGAQEAAFVPGVARMLGLRTLTVLGIRRELGYLAVFGSYYDIPSAGRVAWSGEVHVPTSRSIDLFGRGTRTKLAALAQFLTAAQPSADVLPIGTAEPDPSEGNGWSRWPSYVAGTAALGGFALGGYLLHLNGKDTCDPEPMAECKHVYNTRTQGLIVLGGGAAAGAFAVTWWYLHARSSKLAPLAALGPSGTGWAFTVSGRF